MKLIPSKSVYRVDRPPVKAQVRVNDADAVVLRVNDADAVVLHTLMRIPPHALADVPAQEIRLGVPVYYSYTFEPVADDAPEMQCLLHLYPAPKEAYDLLLTYES